MDTIGGIRSKPPLALRAHPLSALPGGAGYRPPSVSGNRIFRGRRARISYLAGAQGLRPFPRQSPFPVLNKRKVYGCLSLSDGRSAALPPWRAVSAPCGRSPGGQNVPRTPQPVRCGYFRRLAPLSLKSPPDARGGLLRGCLWTAQEGSPETLVSGLWNNAKHCVVGTQCDCIHIVQKATQIGMTTQTKNYIHKQ